MMVILYLVVLLNNRYQPLPPFTMIFIRSTLIVLIFDWFKEASHTRYLNFGSNLIVVSSCLILTFLNSFLKCPLMYMFLFYLLHGQAQRSSKFSMLPINWILEVIHFPLQISDELIVKIPLLRIARKDYFLLKNYF
jgi:hypothetical protein